MTSLLDLDQNYILRLNERNYRLRGKPVQGGSSLVYKARPEEGESSQHVMIKEFYPFWLGIERKADGSILVPEQNREKFEKMKSRVWRESEIANDLCDDGENNNPWFLPYSKPVEPAYPLNTLYTIIETKSGDMLSTLMEEGYFQDKKFIDLCDYMMQLLAALKPIHDKGYLHLDVSPDNIFVSDLKTVSTDTRISHLIDFNSAYRLNDKASDWIISTKPGYSAIELTSFGAGTKPPSLSFATDLYSVAAIFCELLTGTPPKDEIFLNQQGSFVTGKEDFLKGSSTLLIDRINEFLRQNLSIKQTRRCQCIEEMHGQIENLKQLSQIIKLVHSPKQPFPHFVYREAELKQISERLRQESFVILEGLGGIGKTELAKKYAYQYQDDYDVIQFVAFRDSLESTIGLSLQFHQFDADMTAEYELKYGKDSLRYLFLDKMKRLKKHKYDGDRILIIIDNYNRIADNDFQEFISGGYKVIFTSRVIHKDYQKNVIPVTSMQSKNDLLGLFHEYYGPPKLAPEEEPIVQDIINLVLGHTMTVTLIAAAMRKNRKSPEEMFKLLQAGLDPDLLTKISVDKEEIDAGDRERIMYDHIVTLFNFSEIRKKRNCSFIMTNMAIIPYTGVETRSFYHWALQGRYKKEDFSDVEWLAEHRWIQLEDDHVSLHPVISDVVYRRFKPDSKKCGALIQAMIGFINEDPDKTYIGQHKFHNLLELACMRIADQSELTMTLYYLYANISERIADYASALVYYRNALTISLEIFGVEHANTYRLYSNIGSIYSDTGQNDEALALYQTALDIRLNLSAEKSGDIDIVYNNIGSIYQRSGKYEEALAFYQKALEIELAEYGEDHPLTATTNNNIGSLYADTDRNDDALAYFLKALNARLSHFGEEHPDTAFSYSSIGAVFINSGKHDNALTHYQKALDIRRKAYGEEHPLTASSLNDIGLIYANLDQNDEALKYLEKTLTVRLNVYGGDHPDVAATYDNISSVYANLGQYQIAQGCLDKAAAIFRKIKGEDHPDTIGVYFKLSSVYYKQENYAKSLEWDQKALAGRKIVFGETSAEAALSFSNIGVLYRKMQAYEDSLENHFQALAIREKLFGLEDRQTAGSYKRIADTYRDAGNIRQALEYYHKAVSNPANASKDLYRSLSEIYDKLGKQDTAREFQQKADAYQSDP